MLKQYKSNIQVYVKIIFDLVKTKQEGIWIKINIFYTSNSTLYEELM